MSSAPQRARTIAYRASRSQRQPGPAAFGPSAVTGRRCQRCWCLAGLGWLNRNDRFRSEPTRLRGEGGKVWNR